MPWGDLIFCIVRNFDVRKIESHRTLIPLETRSYGPELSFLPDPDPTLQKKKSDPTHRKTPDPIKYSILSFFYFFIVIDKRFRGKNRNIRPSI